MSFAQALRCTDMSYADVNGLSLYYAEHGSSEGGTPLILLHGGYGTGADFEPAMPELAKNRKVIAVDLQAHGRTADIDRPLRYPAMADDIAGLIRHLGLAEADVLGYSLGGGVALRLAIQHPELIRRLVVVSQAPRRDAWYPEVRAGFDGMGSHLAEAFKQSPMYAQYMNVAPRVQDWPVLMDKIGDLLRQDYDWSAEVAAFTMPVLLAFGDADSIPAAEIAEFYRLLGGGLRDGNWDGSTRPASRLAIVPGRVHTDMWGGPELAAIVTGFLDTTTLVPPPMGMPG
jgi:pimeloyl-ACP methyl ester carboxylesterase